MKFEEIIGQEAVKAHLLDALHNGRIAHAQLFTGSPGTGALPMALAYAQLVVSHIRNSEWNEEADQGSWLKAEKLIHPDIHFVFPVNKTDSIKPRHPISDDFVALFRDAVLADPYLNLNDWYNHIGLGNSQGLISVHESASLLKKLSLKPFESEYKVMIIWMPEQMNIAAANKLLKILEEPPAKTLFLLVAEDTEKLLSTILSRTQIVKMSPLSTQQVSDALIQKHGVSPEAAMSVAHLASGNLQLAQSMLKHSESGDFNRQEFINWMRLCFSKDVGALLKWCEGLARVNRENLKLFFEYALHMFRESLIMNYADNSLLRLEGPEREFANKFAPFINQANCMQMIQEFEQASLHVQRNANAKILLFDLSIQVMKLIKVKPVAQN